MTLLSVVIDIVLLIAKFDNRCPIRTAIFPKIRKHDHIGEKIAVGLRSRLAIRDRAVPVLVYSTEDVLGMMSFALSSLLDKLLVTLLPE